MSTPSPVPFFDVLDRALAHHVGDEAAMFVKMVFSLHDPAEIRGLLQVAGFHDARVETRQKTLRLPPAADFLWQYVHCTPLTGTISQLAEEQIRAIEHEVIQGWAPWSDHDGMTYDQRVVVAAAEK